jgi:beta-lactamase class A
MNKKLFIFSLILLFSQIAFAQNPDAAAGKNNSALDGRIRSAIKDFKGKVWIYAKNLDTGRDYALRADEQVRTASTIKLPIMAETFRQVAAGKLKWSDELLLTREKKVGGLGILHEFSDGSKLDLRTAVHLMIVVSDNTATNLVLDKVTSDSVNEFMDALGLRQTRSLRKVFGGGDSKAFGLGVSTPRDMVKLLEMLENGKVVSPEASAEMLAVLKRQQLKDGIGRGLAEIPSASKSGALDRLRSDVGIIYTPRGRIAMAITVDDMPDVLYNQENPGLKMIWQLSQILQDGLGEMKESTEKTR